MAGEISFGLLDASIPGKVANSFYQGQHEQQQNALLAAQLKHAQNQDALAQYQLSSAQRADEVQNGLLKNLQAGMDPIKAYTMAGQADKASKLQTDQATLEKTKTETSLKRSQAIGGALVAAHASPDDATLANAFDTLDALGIPTINTRAQFAAITDPEQRRALIKSIALGTTEGREALQAIMPKAEKLDSGANISQVNVNPLAGQVGVPIAGAPVVAKQATPDAVMTDARTRAEKAADRAQSERHFQITDARSRDTLEQGKVPQGYRRAADGNLQAIPGGPADLKIQGQFNQDTASLNASISAMDRLATAANEAMQHPGLAGTAGLRGVIPNIPGTDAANAAALLNTLKSQVAFGVLQDMRNNSKTGGALGNVSDAEGKRLEANLAALEKSQSVGQLKASLKKIIEYSQGAKERLGSAYNMRYRTAEGSGANLPAPNRGAAPAEKQGIKFLGFE